MSTYNGAKYLREQIESLLSQTIKVEILVRDDGSTDSTQQILDDYAKRGILTWYKGENLGPGKSFFDLVQKAPVADYYAFADQDDIWHKEKIQKAIEMLAVYSNTIPSLYCGDYIPVDSMLRPIQIKKQAKAITPSLGSALVECIAPGCTFVFNYKTLEMFRQYKNNFIYAHDWDLYRIFMAVGGNLIYDVNAYILYRQHNNNVVGIQQCMIGKWLHRLNNYRNSLYRRRCSSTAKYIKHVYGQVIPKYNMAQLDILIGIPEKWICRFRFICSKNFRRSNIIDNSVFKLLALIGLL